MSSDVQRFEQMPPTSSTANAEGVQQRANVETRLRVTADGECVQTPTVQPLTLPPDALTNARDDIIERQGLVMRLASQLLRETSLDKPLERLVNAAYEVLDCDRVSLFLLEGESLVCRVAPPGEEIGWLVGLGDGIVGSVGANGMTSNIADASMQREYVNPGGSQALNGATYKTTSVLCAPVKDSGDRVIGVLHAVNKRSDNVDADKHIAFDDIDETMLDLLLALVVQQLTVVKPLKRTNLKCQNLLACIAQIGQLVKQEGLTVKTVVGAILGHTHAIVECERCTLFVVDNMNKLLLGHWTEAGDTSHTVKQLRIPIQGIAGLVASTGRWLNIKDAWHDDRFCNETDIRTGYRTKTILCTPLVSSNGQVIAVVQCINKVRNEFFDSDDERTFLTVSTFLSDHLQRFFAEKSYEAFLDGNEHINDEVKGMILQSRMPSLLKPYVVTSPTSRRAASLRSDDWHVLLRSMSSWVFDQFELAAHNECMPYISACFDSLNLFTMFGLNGQALCNVVEVLRTCYSSRTSYHTWAHAFATFHSTFLLLDNPGIAGVLNKEDMLAVLLAALGHDVEHQGYNNAFLVNSQDKLALLYNDISVLENHHASATCNIIASSDPYIFAQCEPALRNHMRKVIVTTILGTDMAHHQEIVTWMETTNIDLPAVRMASNQVEKDAALNLTRGLLHCADIVHPTLPWKLHKRQSLLLAAEFFAQYEEEQRLGLPSLPFMGKDPNSLPALAPIQVGFIQFVEVPLWKALNLAVGEDMLAFTLTNLETNRQVWQQLADGNDVSDEQPFREPGVL